MLAPAQELMLSAMTDRLLSRLLMTDSRPSGQQSVLSGLPPTAGAASSQVIRVQSCVRAAFLTAASTVVHYGNISSSIKIYNSFLPPRVGNGNPQRFQLIVRGSGLGLGTHTADDRRAVSLDPLSWECRAGNGVSTEILKA